MSDLRGPCVAAQHLGDTAFFAMADGTIRWGAEGDRSVRAHSALLGAAPAQWDRALLTGGEDGRVCLTDAAGTVTDVAQVGRKWITAVAADAAGRVAYASGRSAWLRDRSGAVRELSHPCTVKALALSRDGTRLGIAHQQGITLHATSGVHEPISFAFSGIHAALGFSPDGAYVLVATQDIGLHGWRLQDRQHFRMLGYAAKVAGWAWSADGAWLATAGAASAVAWRFDGENGPIGTTAAELGLRDGQVVSAVSCHPCVPTIAIGYSDGAIQLAGFDSSVPVPIRSPGRAAISSLSWHPSGSSLTFGSEAGECGVLAWTKP